MPLNALEEVNFSAEVLDPLGNGGLTDCYQKSNALLKYILNPHVHHHSEATFLSKMMPKRIPTVNCQSGGIYI